MAESDAEDNRMKKLNQLVVPLIPPPAAYRRSLPFALQIADALETINQHTTLVTLLVRKNAIRDQLQTLYHNLFSRPLQYGSVAVGERHRKTKRGTGLARLTHASQRGQISY